MCSSLEMFILLNINFPFQYIVSTPSVPHLFLDNTFIASITDLITSSSNFFSTSNHVNSANDLSILESAHQSNYDSTSPIPRIVHIRPQRHKQVPLKYQDFTSILYSFFHTVKFVPLPVSSDHISNQNI